MFNIESFKANLESVHEFPCEYCFKFIANKDNIDELREVLKEHNIAEKESSKGNFISVTIRKNVESSEEILDIYNSISHIKGIMSL